MLNELTQVVNSHVYNWPRVKSGNIRLQHEPIDEGGYQITMRGNLQCHDVRGFRNRHTSSSVLEVLLCVPVVLLASCSRQDNAKCPGVAWVTRILCVCRTRQLSEVSCSSLKFYLRNLPFPTMYVTKSAIGYTMDCLCQNKGDSVEGTLAHAR